VGTRDVGDASASLMAGACLTSTEDDVNSSRLANRLQLRLPCRHLPVPRATDICRGTSLIVHTIFYRLSILIETTSILSTTSRHADDYTIHMDYETLLLVVLGVNAFVKYILLLTHASCSVMVFCKKRTNGRLHRHNLYTSPSNGVSYGCSARGVNLAKWRLDPSVQSRIAVCAVTRLSCKI
jgi:hypothetical protein